MLHIHITCNDKDAVDIKVDTSKPSYKNKSRECVKKLTESDKNPTITEAFSILIGFIRYCLRLIKSLKGNVDFNL